MIYRDVYFAKNIITHGNGITDISYTGNMYAYASTMKDFIKKFDRSKDLYIPCNDCAKQKYRSIRKIKLKK